MALPPCPGRILRPQAGLHVDECLGGVQARCGHRAREIVTVIQSAHQCLDQCRTDALTASGAQHRAGAVIVDHEGGRHHRAQTRSGVQGMPASRVQVCFAQHVVERDTVHDGAGVGPVRHRQCRDAPLGIDDRQVRRTAPHPTAMSMRRLDQRIRKVGPRIGDLGDEPECLEHDRTAKGGWGIGP